MFVEQILQALLALHEIDQQLLAAEGELSREPGIVSRDRAALDVLTKKKASLAAQLVTAKEALRKSERELEEIEKRRDRARSRIASLTTGAQIDATEREIAEMSRQGGEIEERVLLAMEQVDRLTEQSAAAEKSVEAAKLALAEREALWVSRQAILASRAAELRVQRATAVAPIDSDAVHQYTLGLHDRRYHPSAGITRIEGGVCVSCHQKIPPLWVQEAKVFRLLHACQGCGRVLMVDLLPV